MVLLWWDARWLELDRGQEDDDHDIPQPWWQRSNSNNHNGRRKHNHYHMDNEDDRKTIGRRWRSQPCTCSRRFSPCLAPLVLICFDHRIDAYSKRNIGLLVAHASGQPCQILKHALGWVDCVTGRFEIISYIRIYIYICNLLTPPCHPCTAHVCVQTMMDLKSRGKSNMGLRSTCFTSCYCLDCMLNWTRQAGGEHFPEHCLTTPWSVEENLPSKKPSSGEANAWYKDVERIRIETDGAILPPVWSTNDALSVKLTLPTV